MKSILLFVITVSLSILSPAYCQKAFPDTLEYIVPTVINDSSFLIYIDPSIMSETDQNKVMNALLKISLENNAFEKVTVKPNQNVYSIVKENNNFSLQKRFIKLNKLQKTIKEINNLSNDYTIYPGDSLLLPLLPSKPIVKSDINNIQFIDLYKKEKTVVFTDSLIFYGNNISNNDPLEKAAAWAYNLNKEDYQNFKVTITEDIFNKLYGKAIIEIREPIISEVHFPIENDKFSTISFNSQPDETLLDIIKDIDYKYYREYYIIDFFDSRKCLHGDKVLDVIRSRLSEYKIDHVYKNIIPVPINFFDNPDKSLKFLEDYYHNVDLKKYPHLSRWKENGINDIKSLKKIKYKSLEKCPTCIPEIYLDACIKFYYNEKPDIISTSFYISTYDVNLMPKFFNSSPTNLITAVLNDQGRKIEDLFNKEPSPYAPMNSIEPLSALFFNYANSGGIIVGNNIGGGKFHGMYSSNGDKVTILGKGIGWGGESTCIKTSDKGASYATPDIGINLFIAKAFWRSKSLKVTPTEARKRLLLCVDIEPEFIGKFASGGTLNLLKLLTVSDAIAEDNSGNIIPIKIDNNSYIQYNSGRTSFFSNDNNDISGLTLIDSTAYSFFNSSINWKEIKIDQLQLRINLNSEQRNYSSIIDLKKDFKQIIFFKP